MYVIIFLILLAAAYSLLLLFTTGLGGWFIALWIVSGILAGLITLVLLIILFIEIGAKTSPKSKFKLFVLRNGTWIIIHFLHVHLTCEGVENINKKEPFVIYSNHKSISDPVMIYQCLNTVISAIGKKDLVKSWPMNHIFKCFGAIPLDRENDREAAKSMITAIKAVKDGLPMIIFPEGGIKTRDVEEMVNLRAGAYKLAMKAGAPIIPTTILGSSEISKLPRLKRKNVHIIFHKPITKDEYQGKNTTEIGTYVENIINEDVRKYEEK